MRRVRSSQTVKLRTDGIRRASEVPAMPAVDRRAGHDHSTWMSSSPRCASGAVDNQCSSSDLASAAYAFTVCGDRPRSSPTYRVHASSTSSNGAGRSLLREAAVDSGGT